MSESLLQQAEATANQEATARPAGHVVFDGRNPKLLDHHGYALMPLIRKPSPMRSGLHKAFWVEPELLAEIEYRAKSAEGKVRHPFFKGLREDL
jgi:ATP-dependent DNA ligase